MSILKIKNEQDVFESVASLRGEGVPTGGTTNQVLRKKSNTNYDTEWANTETIQYETMPTASSTYDGKIVEFIGTTTSSYTNGYFYKCSQTTVTTPATLTLTTSGTAGLGTVTGNANTFGDKVDNFEDTYNFEYNAQVETIKVGASGEGEFTLTRSRNDDENDMFAWVTSNDTTFFTSTQTPDYETLFYSVAENDSNYASSLWFVEILTYSNTYGKWQLDLDLGGDYYEDINLSEYGLSYNGVASIGAKITAVYEAEISNSGVYAWTQHNVQPAESEIDDTSTASNKTWSACKINTMIGNVESLLEAI